MAGNAPDAAVLEITLLGPTLKVLQPCVACLAGALVQPKLNGRRQPMDQPLELKPGDELDVGRVTRGARVYLAFGGGIDVPTILGSRSTYTRAGFGGLGGRALQPGDGLALGRRNKEPAHVPQVPLPATDVAAVRVVLGPQDDHFSVATLEEFLSVPFEISGDADRMGYRLAGHTVKHSGPTEIVSDGVVLGSIQVPPHGNPIVMLADRASMGGYPKIATVASVDVRLVAQCRPGMKLRFQAVSASEARRALLEQERHYFGGRVGGGSFPVGEVAALLAAMERSGANYASVEAPDFMLRLTR
jgi:antagonist of KipI